MMFKPVGPFSGQKYMIILIEQEALFTIKDWFSNKLSIPCYKKA